MTTSYLSEGLYYAGIGMVVGGCWGVLKAYKNIHWNRKSNENDRNQIFYQYKYVLMDNEVVEAFHKFKMYQHIIPNEFESILQNFDKLIELQVRINDQNVEARYPYQATTYVTRIHSILNKCKSKVQNISVPHWDTDEGLLKQIADDYLYNITQDVNQYLITSNKK
jgi:hypothetical protein